MGQADTLCIRSPYSGNSNSESPNDWRRKPPCAGAALAENRCHALPTAVHHDVARPRALLVVVSRITFQPRTRPNSIRLARNVLDAWLVRGNELSQSGALVWQDGHSIE